MSDERDERLKEIEARVNGNIETLRTVIEEGGATYTNEGHVIFLRALLKDCEDIPWLIEQLRARKDGDLISRKAAIEALKHEWVNGANNEMIRNGISIAKEIIASLGAAIVSESPRLDDLIAKMLYAMIHEVKAAEWRRDTEMDKITERIEEQREHGIGPPNQVDWSHHSMLVGHLIGTRNALRILQEFASKGTATLSVAPESEEGQ